MHSSSFPVPGLQVMYASSGPWSNRLVAIDAVVQRRPPSTLLSTEARGRALACVSE